jgi:DNA modification methylase
MPINKLILGDNLEILKNMENESVDLIYLDPPFFSNRNYEVIWGDTGEIRSFQDRWAGGISHYIDWLKERVIEMHRILKLTGSIFLHCDWHANAYIRVDILDKVFGEKNFRNEIIWQKIRSSKKQAIQFGNVHDVIYFYTKDKGNKFTFNQQFVALDPKRLETHYNNLEKETNRYYMLDNFTQAGQGEAKYFNGILMEPPKGKHWIWTQEKIDEGLKIGRIVFSSNGKPRVKRYYDESKGNPVEDIWIDITPVNSQATERIGYPTQKPEALMERIIKCASNEGDIVIDPFVGGGTTIAVADRLNRQWIGIDQSPMAVKVTEFRLQKQTDLFTAPYTVQLYKYDYDTLRYKDAFEFENWIVQQLGGTPNIKQRGDLGLDGKMGDNTPIQVKRSDNIGRNVIDNFMSAVQRYDKNLFTKNKKSKNPVGYVIAFSFSKGAIEEVARLKNKENIIVKLVKVDEIVPIAIKPAVGIHINELEKDEKGNRKIEFIAQGQSPAGIEFYSWDFTFNKDKGFKPTVIIDKEGKQILTLKTGKHIIAVKVIDNDGLENIEILTLKINGEIEQVN